MNLANAYTYVLEEVTVARMVLVDRLITEDAGRGNVRDNRNDFHRFHCSGCGLMSRAVDLHVGFTQAIIPCPYCWLPAQDVDTHEPTRTKVNTTVPRDVEFYRPLTEEEVELHIEAITQEGINMAKAIPGADPDDPEDDMRIKTQNASATRLLNGLLLPRNLVSRKGDDDVENTRR